MISSITLMRHAESVGNRAGVYEGHGSTGLTSFGHRQAIATANFLQKRDFNRIIVSDSRRTIETANALQQDYVIDLRWRECGMGKWEGLTQDEVHTRFPNEMRYLHGGDCDNYGGGETFDAFTTRVYRAFLATTGLSANLQHTLVVTHGGVIAALLARLLNQFPQDLRYHMSSRITNASLTTLYYDHNGVHLAEVNRSTHLSPVLRRPVAVRPSVKRELVFLALDPIELSGQPHMEDAVIAHWSENMDRILRLDGRGNKTVLSEKLNSPCDEDKSEAESVLSNLESKPRRIGIVATPCQVKAYFERNTLGAERRTHYWLPSHFATSTILVTGRQVVVQDYNQAQTHFCCSS